MVETRFITPASPRELVLACRIAAPRSAVWRCYTEPELMVRWFTPAPWSTDSVEIDLRPGGAMTIVMRSPEGETFPNRGVYLAVEPGVRLVSTDAFVSAWVPSGAPFMVADLRFSDDGDGTLYEVRVGHWTDADVARHEEMGFHAGWLKATEQLEELARSL